MSIYLHCSLCPFTSQDKPSFDRHWRRHDEDDDDNADDAGPAADVKLELGVDGGEWGLFVCDWPGCRDDAGDADDADGTAFASAGQLLRHQETRHGFYDMAKREHDYRVAFLCQHCSVQTSSEDELHVHFRSRHVQPVSYVVADAANADAGGGSDGNDFGDDADDADNQPLRPHRRGVGRKRRKAAPEPTEDGGDDDEASVETAPPPKPKRQRRKLTPVDVSHLTHAHDCSYCYFASDDATECERHERDEHVVVDGTSSPPQHRCTLCDFSCREPGRLRNHVRNYHGKVARAFACEWCPERFMYKTTLAKHAIRAHPDEELLVRAKAREFSATARPANALAEMAAAAAGGEAAAVVKTVRPDQATVKEEAPEGDDEPPASPPGLADALEEEEGGMKREKKSFSAPPANFELRVDVQDRETFSCPDCGLRTSDRYEITQHLKDEHNLKAVHACHHPSCSHSTHLPEGLHRHLRKVHERVRHYRCDKCDFAAFEVQNMRSHYSEVHDAGSQYPCEHCGKMFKILSRLKYHVKMVHGDKPLSCPHCSYKSAMPGDLNIHIRYRHEGYAKLNAQRRGEAGSGSGPGPQRSYKKPFSECSPADFSFVCDECGKKFTTKPNLEGHKNSVHAAVKPFLCDLCGFRTGHKGYMKEHIKKMHREYSCDDCAAQGLSFHTMDKNAYSKHLSTVHVVKCHVCHFASSSAGAAAAGRPAEVEEHNCRDYLVGGAKANLQYEMCDVCGYRPRKANYLAEHVRMVHEKVRPEPCPFPPCDYRGFNKAMMKQHVLNVHEKVKRFECESCGHRVISRQMLRKHMESHKRPMLNCNAPGCSFQTEAKYIMHKHRQEAHV